MILKNKIISIIQYIVYNIVWIFTVLVALNSLWVTFTFFQTHISINITHMLVSTDIFGIPFILLLILEILIVIIIYSIMTKKWLIQGNYFTVITFNQGKTLLYPCIPLLLICIIFLYFPTSLDQLSNYLNFDKNLRLELNALLNYASYFLLMETAMLLAPTLPVVLLRDSWFYFTKIYIKYIKKVTDDIDKIHGLIKALNSYNNYIVKRLGIRFESTILYSKLLNADSKQQENIILIVTESIDDSNKMRLLNALLGLLTNEEREKFFIQETISNKLIRLSATFIPIITILITIIGLVIGKGK